MDSDSDESFHSVEEDQDDKYQDSSIHQAAAVSTSGASEIPDTRRSPMIDTINDAEFKSDQQGASGSVSLQLSKTNPDQRGDWDWREDAQEKQPTHRNTTATDGWDSDDDAELPSGLPVSSKTERSPKERHVDQSSSVHSVSSPVGNEKPVAAAGSNAKSSWSFGGWGSSLLSPSSNILKDTGLSNITGSFTQALTSVVDTFEKTLGAPKPEELALLDNKDKEEKAKEAAEQSNNPSESVPEASAEPASDNKVSGWFSGITSAVQQSSKMVVSTGLDVLEGIGQKTMEVVKDKDPGLRQTKAILTGKGNFPKLSDVLREASESPTDKPSVVSASRSQSSLKTELEKPSFAVYFAEEQGPVSWEALELLSKQCSSRLKDASSDIQPADLERLCEIEDVCQPTETDDDDEDTEWEFSSLAEDLRVAYKKLGSGIPEPHKFLFICNSAEKFLSENGEVPGKDIDLWIKNVHKNCVRTLASMAAKSLEQVRKISEMLFLNCSQGLHSEGKLVDSTRLVRDIVGMFCKAMDSISNQYAASLAPVAAGDSSYPPNLRAHASELVTDIFVESSSSVTYLQDSLSLLCPIFKLAFVETRRMSLAAKLSPKLR